MAQEKKQSNVKGPTREKGLPAPKKQPKPDALTEAMHWALYWLSIFPPVDREGWIYPMGDGHPTRQTLEALHTKGLAEQAKLQIAATGTTTTGIVWRLSKRGWIKLEEVGRPAMEERGDLIEAAIHALTGKEKPGAPVTP